MRDALSYNKIHNEHVKRTKVILGRSHMGNGRLTIVDLVARHLKCPTKPKLCTHEKSCIWLQSSKQMTRSP